MVAQKNEIKQFRAINGIARYHFIGKENQVKMAIPK
jgi:hypothetical protein